jgi:coniferyl-aldehyde dehydrogenase
MASSNTSVFDTALHEDVATGETTIELELLVTRQRAAQIRDGAPSRARRIANLARLKSVLLANRSKIVDAVSQDFGHRSRHETELYELTSVLQGIRYLKRHLAKWMRPSQRTVAMQYAPAVARVEYEPCGVVGIMAPWNYPVALALNPLVVALAAGNRVILKPSEKTPRTGAILKALLREAFDDEHVAVVLGDAELGATFSALPFDHLMFTGGTAIGKAVMSAASRNLVPVTLELGGKSPAFIEQGISLAFAAERLAFGKLLNAGQTCIAPDYVLVPRGQCEAFADAFSAAVNRLYPEIATTPDYTTIANERHFERLERMLADARAKGARVIQLGSDGGERRHPRTFLPALLFDVTDAMQVMQEEIFGPILPIVPYDDVESAIAMFNAKPHPLVLYYFGFNQEISTRVRRASISGAFVVNETVLHYAQEDLPFGGVGASGMGAYHGREGFLRLSHARAVFSQARFSMARLVRPPFRTLVERIIRLMLR